MCNFVRRSFPVVTKSNQRIDILKLIRRYNGGMSIFMENAVFCWKLFVINMFLKARIILILAACKRSLFLMEK